MAGSGGYYANDYSQWTHGIAQPYVQQTYQTYQHAYSAPIHHDPAKESLTATEPANGPDQRPYIPKQTFFQRYFGGLKRTLSFFLLAAIAVLGVNIGWLLRARRLYGVEEGYGTIAHLRCDEAKRLNMWLKLLINVLSTILLTGSGSFMATYCCPSREEVDNAHARKKALHIGLVSLGNLRRISKRKGFVVLLLCVSSIPFHLLYNSLVFVNLSVNRYYYLTTSESYLHGAPYNLTGPISIAGWDSPYFSIPNLPDGSGGRSAFLPYQMYKVTRLYEYFDEFQRNASSWEKLDNKACIQAYSNAYVSNRRNLVLVSSEKNDTDSLITYGNAEPGDEGNWWICSETDDQRGTATCQPSKLLDTAANWKVWDHPINYCMSERVEDMCSVEFSMPIMITVVVFNTIKVFAMLWVLLRFDAEGILATVGDAVVSFLRIQDPHTRGMCLADKRNISQYWRAPGFAHPYIDRKQRWGSAVSKKRWLLYFALVITAFVLIGGFGAWGFSHLKIRGNALDLKSLWAMGFGNVHQDALVAADNQSSTIGMAILANIPQLFLALVWLLFMSATTSMFLAQDWSRFGQTGQALMVSSPRGEQRGTWLLGAPLKFAIPLMALQILLHWFMAQSIFLVQMTAYNQDGSIYQMSDFEEKMINCGFSPMGIVFTVITSLLLVLSSVVLMCRRFPEGSPPMVSTCSAAISAACHPFVSEQHMEYREMIWTASKRFDYGVGHCSLIPESAVKNGLAQKPTVGWQYA